MADDIIYGAIKAYVTANWTACPIQWENEDFVRPEPPGPWVLFEITGNYYEQESIGDSPSGVNRWDEEGVMFFHVLVMKGTGSSLSRRYAKALVNLFRGTLLLGDNLEFMQASIGSGSASDDQGVYWRISVSQEWRRIDSH